MGCAIVFDIDLVCGLKDFNSVTGLVGLDLEDLELMDFRLPVDFDRVGKSGLADMLKYGA